MTALARTGVGVMILTLSLFAGPARAQVSNGSFETGNFSGWQTQDQPGGSGSWTVYSGSPIFNVPPPPHGTFAALTQQQGPGSHILYQDITLAPGVRHELSMFLYYESLNSPIFAPNTLDFTVPFNQQFRVDLVDPGAQLTSLAAGDVLANLFRTTEQDTSILQPTLFTFDLSALAGQTVRLRFAEVDNMFFFHAGVDRVVLKSGAEIIPEPTSMALFFPALALLTLLPAARKRRST